MVEMSQEQAAAMQEKLKNMSPEELKEFQKKQCIFCQIISGKVASKKIYSDEKCTAILDINPANPGHILLLPNEHYSIMPLMPPEELGHIFMVAKALAHASLKALEAQGANIFVANGTTAGQKAQHFMVHVIPRKEGDNVKINIPEKSMNESDTKKIIERLRPAMEKALGKYVKKEEKPKKEEEKHAEPEKAAQKPVKAQEKVHENEGHNSGKFITSEKARRFHSPECPFAEKIPEQDRIYTDEENAREMKKLACGCTGLRGKPKAKKEEPKKNDKPAKKKKEKAAQNEEEAGDATLDDISSLLTGGM